ncbi:Hypothetical protein Tpal_1053 [Trichococcus palustris]|uniref:HlyC/CorC family transporter n=1 Tax=Trichococcus palustris TaxID=140314 RepID=A0A143YEH1_9LACT|nr:hemolysin family protein [Trichococcus palustris]CZQ88811.1 Hypothetical protein Tpal_1053 [Trichococcus palustris]SFL00679.1 putative hemolysin [Trichococcus palustris]
MNPDPADPTLLSKILLIALLTAINAFFATAELAFVSINRSKIEKQAKEGDNKAKRVLRMLENPDDFLATIQVAITLAGFFSSASASSNFVQYLHPLLGNVAGGTTIAMIIITIILSYFTLVFGELYPKQVALQMPEAIARFTAGPIVVVKTVFKPFVWLLSFSTGILKKLTPIEFTREEEKLTRDEMKAILARSRGEGVIDPSEFTMMQGVLSLDTKLARELMVPRTDTLMMDLDDDLEYNIALVLNSQFSRIPVYEEDKDNIIGVLHMKNVLKASKEIGFDKIDFRKLVNTTLFVPSTIYIDDLLVEFRKKHTHMAIIKDEYGGVEGIVTLEDLLEEIVGDIEDEYDEIYRLSKKIDDDNYLVNGRMPLEKFNQLFKTAIESEEVDTIAGYIIEEIGYFPEDEEKVTIRVKDYLLTTTHVESGRIRGIHVTRDPVEEELTVTDE